LKNVIFYKPQQEHFLIKINPKTLFKSDLLTKSTKKLTKNTKNHHKWWCESWKVYLLLQWHKP